MDSFNEGPQLMFSVVIMTGYNLIVYFYLEIKRTEQIFLLSENQCRALKKIVTVSDHNTLYLTYIFSILAGCKALPPLLNIRQVMQQKQVSNVWSNKEELPVSFVLSCQQYVSPKLHLPCAGYFVKGSDKCGF